MSFADDYLDETAASFTALRDDPQHRQVIAEMAELVIAALQGGHKLLLCGNGGSAGDAQHIAAEFVGRLMYDRPPLAALALTTDTSTLTAVANDYGYGQVFARQVAAVGRAGDVLLGLSTSGSSPNVLAALEGARAIGMATIGFTGADGGPMASLCDLVLAVPARRTALIQQLHMTAAHVFCALVERAMFPRA